MKTMKVKGNKMNKNLVVLLLLSMSAGLHAMDSAQPVTVASADTADKLAEALARVQILQKEIDRLHQTVAILQRQLPVPVSTDPLPVRRIASWTDTEPNLGDFAPVRLGLIMYPPTINNNG